MLFAKSSTICCILASLLAVTASPLPGNGDAASGLERRQTGLLSILGERLASTKFKQAVGPAIIGDNTAFFMRNEDKAGTLVVVQQAFKVAITSLASDQVHILDEQFPPGGVTPAIAKKVLATKPGSAGDLHAGKSFVDGVLAVLYEGKPKPSYLEDWATYTPIVMNIDHLVSHSSPSPPAE